MAGTGSRRRNPIGIIASTTSAARISKAFCQPVSEISCCSTGIIANWPKEPAAAEMPKAQERFASGAWRPMMPAIAPNAVQDSAAPIRTPEPSTNSVGWLTSAIHSRPAMYGRAPAITTRAVPRRSAAMPAKGPNTPHIRFCSAIASE